MQDNYQHDQKCPECRKRKVYLHVVAQGADYICKACGHIWAAYREAATQLFKKTTE